MNKNKRRTIMTAIIAGILSAATVLSLAGCSKTDSKSETSRPSAAESGISGTEIQNDNKGADFSNIPTTTLLGESPEWVTKLDAAKNADQLFVVAAHDKTTAWVSMHEKDKNGKWQMIMTTPGYIGREGLGKTKEGDGKTPVGTFGFSAAFGIADDPGCAIPYTKVDENTYWSGDIRDGMQYNRMVDIKDYPDLDKDSSEHIIDYTRHYQYCLNISYNQECKTDAGSAIFLHCLGPNKPYTGGCVAIPENQMKLVMQKVKPDCAVIIDSLEHLGGSF